MNPLAAKLLVVAGVLLVAFGGGWYARGQLEEIEDAKQAQAIQRAVDTFREHEQNVARTLDQKLEKLKANERVIEREIPKIIDRPVYRNVCIDADGLRLLEEARVGKTGAGKPADKVPTKSE